MAHLHILIEARPAPVAVTGLRGKVANLRERGIVNGLLSFLSYAVLFWLGWLVVRWAWSPTWGADSLAECRDIFGDTHGKACWGVIQERWVQLLFGFYPKEFLWRPILAFMLVGTAIFALLRSNTSSSVRKFAVIPFMTSPYLLWGGPVIGLLTSIVAIVAVFIVVKITTFSSSMIRTFLIAAAALVGCFLIVSVPELVPTPLDEIGLETVTSREFGGFLLSFLIGLSAIIFSLPLGIVLALGRTSKLPFLRGVATGFIEFIRGVPLITLLFIASTLLNIFLPPGSNFDIVLRVIIMVTLFASAYIAEIIRGALSAVPTGQTEGAASLGLNYWQTQRLIILPQALKISIPGIVSTFIAVFKDTTLVSIIGLLDPLGLANNIRADSAWTGIVWEIYGFAAFIFFIVCFAMSQYSMWLERKLQTGHR